MDAGILLRPAAAVSALRYYCELGCREFLEADRRLRAVRTGCPTLPDS